MEEEIDDIENRPVEINDLNKTQLILLAILLSFVISIATGIVTVTLMQRASPVVTQTINRIVQQTVEKVVPDYNPDKTQTVVVKEDDLVVDAVSKTRANYFALYADKDVKESIANIYSLGGGKFVGVVASPDLTKSYFTKQKDNVFELSVTSTSPLGFTLFSPKNPTDDFKSFPKLSFGKDSDVKVGQTAIIISDTLVKKGIIQNVTTDGISLDTELSKSLVGSFVANLDGDVIGIIVPKGETEANLISINTINLK